LGFVSLEADLSPAHLWMALPALSDQFRQFRKVFSVQVSAIAGAGLPPGGIGTTSRPLAWNVPMNIADLGIR
jgi:hypothetical protein